MTDKPTADLAVINGMLVDSQKIELADVYVTNGKVTSIKQAGNQRPAKEIVDAAGKYVLPGIIDAHLHPVYADRIDTLSRAAACEGITTLIPYIGAVKAWGKTGGLLAAIDDFISEGEQTSLVDFGIHCTLMQADLDEVEHTIPKLIERGIVSFKAFMAYAKRGMKLEDHELLRIMTIVGRHGGLFAAHAENGDIIDYMEERFTAEGKEGPEYFCPSHPNLSEAEAVFRLLTLAQTADCPIYLPHISTSESLEVIELFRKWDTVKFHVETCPHYLTLTEEEMTKRGSLAKMAPPLRRMADIESLWRAVRDHRIDVIASDAAGHTITSNEPLYDNVFKAPNGIPGLDTLLKVIYDEGVNKGRLTLPELVAVLCENPARIFGLYPEKGVLRPGADADIVIFDPKITHTIAQGHPELKVDYSMYEGRQCLGAPERVILRGRTLYEDGRITGGPGQGQYLPARLGA